MLWPEDDQAKWTAQFSKYDAVLNTLSQKKPTLVALDNWMRQELPSLITSRSPPHMIKSELSKLMTWKLTKGKWRPKLQMYIDALKEDDIIQATTLAFEQCDKQEIGKAMKSAIVLKGIGPATASAILSVYDPSIPFMADEALEAVSHIIGKRQYTMPHFLRYIETLREKAETLEWTAQKVQLCLWAEKHSPIIDEEEPKLKKQKRR